MFLAISKKEEVLEAKEEDLVIIIIIDYPPMKSRQIHLLIIQEVEEIEIEGKVEGKVEVKEEAKEGVFLILQSMQKIFWVEPIACAVHILNICPTKSVESKTPGHAWTRIKPFSHLRVFGSIIYVHIPSALRVKLDDIG